MTDRRLGWLLLAPALALLGGLTIYPAVWVIWLSLQYRIPVFSISRWAGLAHYAFLAVDTRFWNAAAVTAVFTVASVALEGGLGLAMALGLRGQRHGRRAAVALLLLAWALPSVVTAKLFEWLYHPAGGLVNFLLGGRPVNWLGDPALALPSLIVADVWRTTPFVALLCYARLLTIPGELYEAAEVDGASGWAAFWSLTLPLLRPIIAVTLILRTTFAFMVFDEILAITQGGPGNDTWVAAWYTYKMTFQPPFNIGLGAASAWGLTLIIGAFALLYVRFVYRRVEW